MQREKPCTANRLSPPVSTTAGFSKFDEVLSNSPQIPSFKRSQRSGFDAISSNPPFLSNLQLLPLVQALLVNLFAVIRLSNTVLPKFHQIRCLCQSPGKKIRLNIPPISPLPAFRFSCISHEMSWCYTVVISQFSLWIGKMINRTSGVQTIENIPLSLCTYGYRNTCESFGENSTEIVCFLRAFLIFPNGPFLFP